MAKILVLYYSMYGHIETMAHAVADGANRVDGVEVVVKRVPETMQAEAFAKAGGKTQNAPVATPQELAEYDAIIFGTPTRFGNMSGQMRTFLDQTGGLWASGALYGKIASVFSSTGTCKKISVEITKALLSGCALQHPSGRAFQPNKKSGEDHFWFFM